MFRNTNGGIGKVVLIILGSVAIVLAILITIGMWHTSGMKENADAFFAALRSGDYTGAYALTSASFREATSVEELKARMEGAPIVGVEWGSEHSMDGDKKRLDAEFIMKSGARAPISVTMVREGNAWKVFAIDPRVAEEKPKADEGDDEALEGSSWGVNWSTARIADAFLTKSIDDPNAITKENRFSSDIEKIYCAVKLANAPEDTEVTARWIFQGGEGSDLKDYEIGTVTQPSKGDAYLTFIVTRPEGGFPKGDYIVKLFINGKKREKVSFTIGE